MRKVNFKMVLNIAGWLFLGLAGAWLVALILFLDLDVFTTCLGFILIIMSVCSFVLHSLMREYPQNQNRYFIEWLVLFFFIVFMTFTVYVFNQ